MVLGPALRWTRDGYAALRRQELRVLVVGLAVAGCLWAFLALESTVARGGPDFDERIVMLLRDPEDPARHRGPSWLPSVVRDVTALGSGAIVLLLVGIVSVALFASGRRRQPLLVIGACLSGLLLTGALKRHFDRARPDPELHAVGTQTSSFPSGHTMNAAIVYLSLGALLAEGQKRRRMVFFALGTGIMLAVLVGASRVYLGVHWPTDVLAGWAAGFGWAALWWLVADRVRARRAARADDPAAADA